MTEEQIRWKNFSTPPLADGHGSQRPDVYCVTCGPKFTPAHYRRSPEVPKGDTYASSSD